ncbi:MAG TPA: type II toxin-antitoxin system VapC family toxin [Acidimicrobiales bacterium]|nr:type II toxin-antitoxin system VapC family toxin [Acidimicrobiales bacterium]
MIVLDASAAAEMTLQTEVGAEVARRLRGHNLHAPGHFDVEVVGVIRRAVQRGLLSDRDGLIALADFRSIRVERWAVNALIARAYDLRATHSVADAVYVTLAEALDAPLVTCDGRLSRSHGHRVAIEFVG